MSEADLRERRQFDRISKSCPVWFSAEELRDELKARTVNLCDGGVLCRLGVDEVPWNVGDFVRLRLNVPRETPNTYFLENVEADCRVVRFEVSREGDDHLMALAFHPRLDLGIRP